LEEDVSVSQSSYRALKIKVWRWSEGFVSNR